MYLNLNLKKLTFTRDETVSECRHARKTQRCGGAFTLLTMLVFAAAMLLHTPVARAAQTSVANPSLSHSLCQVSSAMVFQALVIDSPLVIDRPDISGSFDIKLGTFIEGPAVGAARLVGVVSVGGVEFDVDLILEDRLDPGDTGYSDVCLNFALHPECGVSTDEWHVYTTLNGTLTGLPGSIFDGAVYNVTLRYTELACTEGGTTPAAQVGYGANTHNIQAGVFAPLEFVLANPVDYPSLSSGLLSGELTLDIPNIYEDPATLAQSNFPVPSPDLTGTWEGVIDCAGMLDFKNVETFSSSMTLKIGPPSGFNYSVELSDAGGNVVATYCAEYTDDLSGGQINNGRMINSDTGQPPVLLKVRKDDSGIVTLKAREFFTVREVSTEYAEINDDWVYVDLISDGLDFCKWSFTQVDTADPGITSVCP